ncbi:MAG TPA: DUF4279 domain-containing protein [Tepidisphaeraceae bacterium]|nr:DUF4279 domain-containing protein [Tepidisphaeraceae bacterium]
MEREPNQPRFQDIPPNARLVRFGGRVDRTTVSLRVFGDALNPEEITKLLGHAPTKARRKDDVIPDKRYHRVANTGCWLLESDTPEDVDVEEQILRLLQKLTADLEVWGRLADEFQVDLFCGLFIDDFNRGFSLSSAVLQAMSERRLVIGFDIYCPVDTDH